MSVMPGRLAAFTREYRALCERHGLIVTFDGSYIAREVIELPADEFTDDWTLWEAK